MNTEASPNEERLRTALHESAHAIIGETVGVRVEGFTLSRAKHFNYPSVLSTGHTQFEPHTLMMKDEIVISLAGPLAEQRQFGDCPDIVRLRFYARDSQLTCPPKNSPVEM